MQGKVKILICDDNIAVHESISAYLLAEHMEYESVYNGEEVLRKLEDQHFDLVILDIMLPGLLGQRCAVRFEQLVTSRLLC